MKKMLEIKRIILDIVNNGGAISVFGGGAAYLYKVYKGDEFKAAAFVINLILAFFVGYISGKFMPDIIDGNMRDGILGVSGFLAFPILKILEDKGVSIFLKKFGIEL